MKNFYNKVQAIEKLLPVKKRRDINNRLILACAIYFKIAMKVSFRKVPMNGTSYSWSAIRYWLQKLERLDKLQEIEEIVGGD